MNSSGVRTYYSSDPTLKFYYVFFCRGKIYVSKLTPPLPKESRLFLFWGLHYVFIEKLKLITRAPRVILIFYSFDL